MKEKLFEEALKNHKSGDLLLAEKNYKVILEKFPNDAITLHYYGLIFYQKNNFDQAITFFNKSIRFDPNQSKTYLNRGNAKSFLNNYKNIPPTTPGRSICSKTCSEATYQIIKI